MPTVTITISAGSPSSLYPAEEQARTGAADYNVLISAEGPLASGGVTLWPDKEDDGRMGSCGTPPDVWMSAALLRFIEGLEPEQRQAVIGALEAANSTTLELEPPHALGSRVESRDDDCDAGPVLGMELTEIGWRHEIRAER